MDKKMRLVSIVLVIYLFTIWVAFKAGTINSRSVDVKIEKIAIPAAPVQKTFYVVEEHDQGTYKRVTFDTATNNDLVIKFAANKDLRHLLKMRKLKIYTAEGKRIY